MTEEYHKFLETKKIVVHPSGRKVDSSEIHPSLFPFQRDLTVWSIRKGRSALFADTGLGKTRMQLEWARLVSQPENGKTLIVAPLSVARQTVTEGQKIGIEVVYSRDGTAHPVTITNYEMADKFQPSDFGAVVLDESSILKSLDGKTRSKLTAMFSQTPYRLCCTATPAPNDITEIANHAEFLGIMKREDMLATFFTHDDEGWRLKRHAEEPFYRWLASWGMSVRKPSEIGYSDEGYVLLPLNVIQDFIDTELQPEDTLFWTGLKGITDRSRVRRGTLEERVKFTADMVNRDSDQWILWCGMDNESSALAKAIPDSIEVRGPQKPEQKTEAFEAFQDGKVRVLVTKGRIGGWGLNFQNCHKMAFVGLSDSWEMWYQCIRRCYRFGQKYPVEVHIVISEAERPIYENVQHKEREAAKMFDKLIEHVANFEKAEIQSAESEFQYRTATETGNSWTMMLGDSCERMAELSPESVDLSVFSPPFMSLYVYSPTERDLGNSRDEHRFFFHFRFVIQELLRITKPGRNCCCHVSQVPAMLVKDGFIGLKDFRGKTIELFQSCGWIYHGEVVVDKDPQVQAVRTKSKSLLFVQLRKDSSWLRPGLADYILVFRKPGENAVPINPNITNEEWIEWARPVWYNIRESDTLNVAEGRDSQDERHICALQLGVIERCIRLWSNPGELVCSPFAGIGSEGYMALKLSRCFWGCELKPSYYETGVRNLKRAEADTEQEMLISRDAVEHGLSQGFIADETPKADPDSDWI